MKSAGSGLPARAHHKLAFRPGGFFRTEKLIADESSLSIHLLKRDPSSLTRRALQIGVHRAIRLTPLYPPRANPEVTSAARPLIDGRVNGRTIQKINPH